MDHKTSRYSAVGLSFVMAFFGQAVLAQSKPSTEVPRPVRQTTDKQPLPNPTSIGTTAKLAVVGSRLGGLPERACGRLWTIDGDASFVEQTRREMNKADIDLDGFNYVGDSIAGFTRCAIRVDNGLVRKLIMTRPSLTDNSAIALMEKIASDAQSRAKMDAVTGVITFKVKGIAFYERVVGRWNKVTPAESHRVLSVNGSSTVNNIPEKRESGPAGIEIGIADNDWYALIVSKDPAVLKAIQDGVLSKGMKPVEAYLAMRDFKLYRQSVGKTQVWTWTDRKLEASDMSVTVSDLGTFTRTNYSNAERPIAKATFVNGVIDTIEDEETMSAPPK